MFIEFICTMHLFEGTADTQLGPNNEGKCDLITGPTLKLKFCFGWSRSKVCRVSDSDLEFCRLRMCYVSFEATADLDQTQG